MKNITRVVLIISLIICFTAIGGTMAAVFVEKITVKNTKELTATVKSVNTEMLETGERLSILTEEYSFALVIMDSSTIINRNDFNNLKAGQLIKFRIENFLPKQSKKETEEFFFEGIYSLETSEKEIISLESFNQWMDQTRSGAKNIGIPFSIISLLVSIVCVVILRKSNNANKLKENIKTDNDTNSL